MYIESGCLLIKYTKPKYRFECENIVTLLLFGNKKYGELGYKNNYIYFKVKLVVLKRIN